MGVSHSWLRGSSSYDPLYDLPKLTKLMNDHVRHDPWWPPIPMKLPFNIHNFEGKPGENTCTHITTYHLWCSSKYLVDDSIKLCLLQCTLTRDATKWYTEQDRIPYSDFSSLAQTFLIHYQLPTRYDINFNLMSNFKYDNSTIVYDHIHEWRQRKRLV